MLQETPGGYDAVFIDWQMPGLDGWQTCDRIRQQSLAGQAPVVVMVTAHGREMLEQRSEEEQRQLDGFLVKPVTASMLYDAIAEARQGCASAPPRLATPGSTERRLAGLRLLVVEDNANNQQVARELLEDEGAEVVIAGNGQLGVEAVAAAEPAFDIVLMDLQMPVMDGYTATSRIRQDLGRLDLPIVAMTANALSSDREACLAAGMNEHVGKPFDLDHLVQVLRRLSQRDEAAAPVRAAAPAPNGDLLQAGAAAGVDIGTAVARLGGKLGTYRRLLQGFVRDLAAMPGQLRTQADSGQWAEASRQMHTVKGLAATLGAGPLSSQAAAAEQMFRQAPGSDEAQRGLQTIEAAITRALPGLGALCEQLDREADAPGDAAATSATIDKAGLADMLQTLARLLADSDMDALNLMDRLRATPAGALSSRVEALDEAVVTLDFDRAQQACEALIEEIRT
jgi:CheY-like chemotaxis protein